MNATIENRLGMVSSLAAVILIVAGWLSYQNTQRLILVNGRVTETNVVLAAISQTFSAIQDAQNRATDFAIVRDEQFRVSYYASVAEAQKQFDHLRSLTSDNPRQQARLDRLDDQIENAFSIFHLVMNLPQGEKFAAATAAQLQVREEKCMDGIRQDIPGHGTGGAPLTRPTQRGVRGQRPQHHLHRRVRKRPGCGHPDTGERRPAPRHCPARKSGEGSEFFRAALPFTLSA